MLSSPTGGLGKGIWEAFFKSPLSTQNVFLGKDKDTKRKGRPLRVFTGDLGPPTAKKGATERILQLTFGDSGSFLPG